MSSKDGKRDSTARAVAFAAVCIGLAIAHLLHPLDSKFIGLVLLATAPIFLPWVQQKISSMKVGGVEVNFRELKAQVDQNRQMVQATAAQVMAVTEKPGKAKADRRARQARAGVDAGAPLAHDPMKPALVIGEAAIASESDANDDPNKDQFGGSPEHDGLRLRAKVTPMPQSTGYFLVHAWVEASAGAQALDDGTEVVFHLHQTFAEPVVRVEAQDGVAAIDRLAWGAFTIGAEIGTVRLELDLAGLRGAPPEFRAK